MPEPLLNRPQVNPRPQTSGCEGRAELVQPEVLFIELRSLGASLQAVEKIQLRIAPGSREHQPTCLVRLRFPSFQFLHQLRRNRNLTLFVGLRCPCAIWLMGDANRRVSEVDV